MSKNTTADNARLRQLDEIIFKIRSKLDYQKFLTPKNFSSENQKFSECYSKGKVYNPQYRYEKFSIDPNCKAVIESVIQELTDYKHQAMGLILYNSALSLKKEIELYHSIGDGITFSQLSEEVYGRPHDLLFEKAKDIISNTVAVKNDDELYTAEELSNVLENRLKRYGYNWQIQISESMAARVSVEPEQKKVYIKKGSMFSENDMVRLQVHEIDTHILRCENGAKRGYTVFSSGTYGSLIHEEGLALYNEWKNDVCDPTILKLYAARFLTCCYIDRSFYDLFDMLTGYGCPSRQAMYVVSRIKRGISDTSKPGGFNKDYVYFQGFYEIKDFLEKAEGRYPDLYYGSISLNDLELLQSSIEKEKISGNITLPIPIK